MTEFNVMIVGVGGQGTILASDILGRAAVLGGIPVRASETHGMAQRGGSVVNHVRLDCRYGPLIPAGRANAILGLEPLETLRIIDYLSHDGVVVVNTNPVHPITSLSGGVKYPPVEEILTILSKHCSKLVALDADKLAVQAGHHLTANVVLIGALSHFLPLDIEYLKQSISSLVPKKTVDVNLNAFRLGRESV